MHSELTNSVKTAVPRNSTANNLMESRQAITTAGLVTLSASPESRTASQS